MHTSSTFSRNFLSYLAVFLLSPLLGLLIAWDERTSLLVLGVLLGSFLVIFAIQSVERSLLLLFLSFLIVDPIRRLVGYYSASWGVTYFWLLVIDVALIVALFAFYAPSLVQRNAYLSAVLKMLPRHFKLVLSLFILLVILQTLNPYYPSAILSLAAIREYLLAIPALGFGWFVVRYWKHQQWRWVYKIILLTALGVVAISLVQMAIPPGQIGGIAEALLLPADTTEHSWGEGGVRLISSVFASSKRYGQFLLLSYPLVWAYLSTQKKRFRVIVFMLYAVGCFVSGSREAIYLILIMELLLESRKSLVNLLIIFLVGLLAIPMLTSIGFIEDYRLAFILADPEDWGSRFGYMSLADLALVNVNVPYLFGIGAGRSGQPIQLLGLPYGDSLLGPITSIGAVGDAGLFRILVELGIGGLIIFLVLQGIILYKAWPWRSENRQDPYCLAASVAILVWFIMFLKRHTLLSDQAAMIFFWFYVGIVMAKRALTVSTSKDSATF